LIYDVFQCDRLVVSLIARRHIAASIAATIKSSGHQKNNVNARHKLRPISNGNRVSPALPGGQNKNHFGKWTAAIINCQVQKRRATALFAGPFISVKPNSQFEIQHVQTVMAASRWELRLSSNVAETGSCSSHTRAAQSKNGWTK
jgi:hypothetical protein